MRTDSLTSWTDFRYQGVNQFVDLRDDVQRKLSDPLRRDPHIQLTELVTRIALLNASVIRDAVYTMIFLASEIMPVSSDVRRQSRGLAASRQEDLSDPPAKNILLSSSATSGKARLTTKLSSRTPPLSDLYVFGSDLPLVGYDLTVQEVCSNFVRYAIHSTGQLDIICRPWAPEVWDLPSWVRPHSEHAFRVLDDNRYCRANADGLAVLTSTSQTLYSACGTGFLLDKSAASKVFHSRWLMFANGFELGIVDVIAPPASNGILPKEWHQIGKRGNTSKASEGWFWRTLVADRSSTGSACPPWYKLASEQVLQNSDGLDIDTRRLMFESSPGIVFDFLNRVQCVIWGRRLATLDRGFVVLGPGSCEEGDLVCILHGCSVPVILRPRSPGTGYIFIGECYVHGMMDGEAIMLKEQQDLPTKHFKLV